MKKLQDVSAFVFISCVTILAIISILGVWKVFNEDVIGKSIQTITLLAAVTIIITIAGKFFDSRKQQNIPSGVVGVEPQLIKEINPVFVLIRHSTLVTLIVSISVLALLGVLAIWDVLSGETLSKSLSSMTILAFSSSVIILTCLVREGHKFMQKKISGWYIFILVVIGWILLKALLNF